MNGRGEKDLVELNVTDSVDVTGPKPRGGVVILVCHVTLVSNLHQPMIFIEETSKENSKLSRIGKKSRKAIVGMNWVN